MSEAASMNQATCHKCGYVTLEPRATCWECGAPAWFLVPLRDAIRQLELVLDRYPDARCHPREAGLAMSAAIAEVIITWRATANRTAAAPTPPSPPGAAADCCISSPVPGMPPIRVPNRCVFIGTPLKDKFDDPASWLDGRMPQSGDFVEFPAPADFSGEHYDWFQGAD